MNREQAKRILDAYLSTCRKIDADGIYPDSESKKARDALRKMILDAMTERTCHETMIDKFFHGCDSCGYMWQFFYSIGKRERPNYCPKCGCKVVDE